jgi:hypothetical protein
MKFPREEPAPAGRASVSFQTLDRREFVVGSAAAGATLLLPEGIAAAADGKKTFTILHTNDLHSNLIGMGPASDYTPFTLNDDTTRGGFARLATLIAKRKEARAGQGPVLVLDAGDYSMGTAFAAATRETGGELQLLSFPKIISGRIGDAVQPRSEWRQWRQIVGLLDAMAHLSVMPSACALHCNMPHRCKEFGAGASRQR